MSSILKSLFQRITTGTKRSTCSPNSAIQSKTKSHRAFLSVEALEDRLVLSPVPIAPAPPPEADYFLIADAQAEATTGSKVTITVKEYAYATGKVPTNEMSSALSLVVDGISIPLNEYVTSEPTAPCPCVPFKVTSTSEDAEGNPTTIGVRASAKLSANIEALTLPAVILTNGVSSGYVGLDTIMTGGVTVAATSSSIKGSSDFNVLYDITAQSTNVVYAPRSGVDIAGVGFQPECKVIFGLTSTTNYATLFDVPNTANIGPLPFFSNGTELKVDLPNIAQSGLIAIVQHDGHGFMTTSPLQPFVVNQTTPIDAVFADYISRERGQWLQRDMDPSAVDGLDALFAQVEADFWLGKPTII